MDALRPFDDIPKACPKCRSRDIWRQYVHAHGGYKSGLSGRLVPAAPEHLACNCGMCGYQIGNFQPADAPRPKPRKPYRQKMTDREP